MLLHRSGHGSLVGSIDLPAFRGNGDADADLLLGKQIEPLPALVIGVFELILV